MACDPKPCTGSTPPNFDELLHRIPLCTSPEKLRMSQLVEELTLGEGAAIQVGQAYHKVWHLVNDSDQPWPAGSYLAFVDGDCMSATQCYPVPIVNPKATVDIMVEIRALCVLCHFFHGDCNREPRRHLSCWQLFGPDKQPFGVQLWVDVVAIVLDEAEEVC